MVQESANPTQWQEPDKGQNAGIGSWNRPNSPYDNFMESEDIPIYRGIGVQRSIVRSLLASHPAVLAFEDAPPERGGWGATVVRLRPASDLERSHALGELVGERPGD